MFLQLVLFGVSGVPFEGTLDAFRDGWGLGKVSSLGLETVLVSDVSQGDWVAVVVGVLELSLHDYWDLVTNRFWRTGFGGCDSIFGFIAELVAAVWRDVACLTQNCDRTLFQWSGKSDSHEGGKNNLKIMKVFLTITFFVCLKIAFILLYFQTLTIIKKSVLGKKISSNFAKF